MDVETALMFDASPLVRFQADARSQFDIAEFRAQCSEDGILVTLEAPKHQEMNGVCEQTWQSLQNLAFAFMNNACVGEEFGDLALEHAWKVSPCY